MKRSYHILKGCHFSNFFPKIFSNSNFNTLSFSANIAFNDSCKYSVVERSCVNKLFGFSLGLFNIHKHSVRFGWTYNEETDKFYVYRYIYNNGKLTKRVIFKTTVNELNNYTIKISRLKNSKINVIFEVNGQELHSELFDHTYMLLSTLGLYFGGNSRAPHKIKIEYDYSIR